MKPQRRLSSKVAVAAALVLLAACGGEQPAAAQREGAAPLDPAARAVYTARLADNAAGRFGTPLVPLAGIGDPALESVTRWDRLRRDGYAASFAELAGFLRAHPGWPGELTLRRRAERAITAATPMAERSAYFARFPALSAAAKLRHAEALLVARRFDEANRLARDAWDSSGLDATQEAELLLAFGPAITPGDHLDRFDRLLWSGQAGAAARLLGRLPADRQAWGAARLALRSAAPDAEARLAAVPAVQAREPGVIFDRARYLRNRGDVAGARAALAALPATIGRAGDAEAWLEARLEAARQALRGGDAALAYRLAADHAVFPQGRPLAERSLADRVAFVETEWYAGWIALKNLRRFADAQRHFENVRAAAQTPVSQARGDYWTGRAVEAAGRKAEADRHYAEAARHPDYFYGQLAHEKLGRAIARPTTVIATPSPAARAAFDADPVVRATRLLGALDARDRQTIFIRHLAERADTPERQRLTAELGRAIDRLDLGVLTGKAARGDGLALADASYPVLVLPADLQANATLIHAVARQESQFDRAAVSSANARGLMQLLPSTANEVAGQLGLAFDRAALIDDPVYNVRLGSAYFVRVRDSFGGSWPLAAAAYNAGPGNARKFIAANGDPRAGVDVIDWIEAIPIAETRTYVQRVLENAVMYDVLAGRGPTDRRLSRYLGKATAG